MNIKRSQVKLTNIAFELIVPFIIILILGPDLYLIAENIPVVGKFLKLILPSPEGNIIDFIKIIIDTILVAGVIEIIKWKIKKM